MQADYAILMGFMYSAQGHGGIYMGLRFGDVGESREGMAKSDGIYMGLQ